MKGERNLKILNPFPLHAPNLQLGVSEPIKRDASIRECLGVKGRSNWAIAIEVGLEIGLRQCSTRLRERSPRSNVDCSRSSCLNCQSIAIGLIINGELYRNHRILALHTIYFSITSYTLNYFFKNNMQFPVSKNSDIFVGLKVKFISKNLAFLRDKLTAFPGK
ncbi:MAG: hypothetical protein AB4290_14395 [Spirulina sp.]